MKPPFPEILLVFYLGYLGNNQALLPDIVTYRCFIGSGNIVHNLRAVDWHNASGGFEWAEEANSQIRQWIAEKNHNELTNITQRGGIYRMAIPTAEHYLPLLYVLAMQHEADKVSFFNDELTLGSISMTGVILK